MQILSVTSQFLNDDFLIANRLLGYERQITQSLGESPRRGHKYLNLQPNHAGNFFTLFDLSFTPGRCKLWCICHFVKWQIRSGVKLKYTRVESSQQDLVVSWEICARVWGTHQVIESSDVDYRGGRVKPRSPGPFPPNNMLLNAGWITGRCRRRRLDIEPELASSLVCSWL